jgi:23S rRNA pseudouridine1911/1915/1917 synthase
MAAKSVKSLVVDGRIPPPGRRLAALVQRLLGTGTAQAASAIRLGAVRVNRRVAKRPHAMLEVGDRVEVDVAQSAQPPAPVEKLPRSTIKIVYQDEHLVVVIKPPGLLTVPTPHREPHTAISQLTQKLGQREPGAEAFCVHRLDRGVSGLLVFAKSLAIAQAMRDQFAERKPQRRYMAFVAGRVQPPQGTIHSHLATDKDLNRYSTNDVSGQLAITHYRVIESWPDATLVAVRLETGRRNQIRVHFAEMGHPVLGDRRYRASAAAHWAWPYRRLALHAESLAFVHPVTGKELEFHAPPPPEFERLKRKLRGNANKR